jgi:hypothetical protein
MLVNNSISILDGINDFIKKSENVTLYSAYIKTNVIELINFDSKIKQIIVRWQLIDLVNDISDLTLYQYCKENKIILYRNSNIHLKVIKNEKNILLYGSANYTNKGLGLAFNSNNELNGIEVSASFNTLLYLNKIINESELVDYSLFNEISKKVALYKEKIVKIEELSTNKTEKDYLLLSQLPMSTSVDLLFKIIKGQINNNELETSCAIHDINLYNIDLDADYDSYISNLKNAFNNHPFVKEFKYFVMNCDDQSVRYGGVVDWLQKNTTTVPTPRSWELKKDQIVNTLYEWVCFFDKSFTWDIPGGHSQVISFKEIK